MTPDYYATSDSVHRLEYRLAALEEAVKEHQQALEMLLDINKAMYAEIDAMKKGPAASEGISRPVGDDSGPRFSRKD
jgi:hypothetical protein